jgi:hypothetical protein
MMYSADLFAKPAVPTGMATLSKTLTRVLRADGWTVAGVDLRKLRSPLPTVPHPAYQLSRSGLQGAANVLPARVGAQALIFIDSACFDPGPLAKVLERETMRD